MSNAMLFWSRRLGLIGIVSAALLSAGCKDTRGGAIPYNVSDFGQPDAPTPTTLDASYKIAPMDLLTIRVFGVPDLTGDYQVDVLGNVALPLVGEIAAANMTPAQLDSVLTQKFGAKYLQNPDISVAVKSSAGRIVTVDGAVRKGGAFPILGPMTLMQAVALAGGADTDSANMHRVAIFRTIDGQREAAAFDLISIQRGVMKDPPIYSGDIIIVDGSNNKEAQKKLFQMFPLANIFSRF